MPNDSNSSLRRSERQRKLTYGTLNQSYIFNQVSDYFIGPRPPLHHESESNHHEVDSPHDIERERDRRGGICRHRREIVSLNINPHDSDPEEEVLDIYSRVKRRKRRISSAVYETAPHAEESSNQSSLLAAEETNRRTNLTPKKEPIAEMSTDEESSEEQLMQRRYFLREQKSAPQRFNYSVEPLKKRMDVVKNNSDYEQRAFQSPAHKRIKHNFSRRRRTFRRKLENAGSSSTSDTAGSDDEKQFERRLAKSLDRSRNRFLPVNMSPKSSKLNGISRQRNISTAIGADLDPMTIDTTIGFKDIGGLKHHLQTLKEMILFPLIYPEIFEKFKITPPRGVIFYGPPGTGKTLVARALANECFKGEKKVSFFMRKGADCLSKWVGESERQLRLLFDQAYTMRPSIIFFDEIDGLAPMRSSRQDQIHSSIVSTLLALMDGLDQRGEIIVIGATNRLDAIDPALRRPGRFDRELLFKLPDKEARCQILKIHTSDWNPPLQDDFIETLSSKLVGYCGADIKGLCTEAALIALRKKFPQIYCSEKRLQVDSSAVTVTVQDFETAIHHLVPSTKRGLSSVSRQLPEHLAPLLSQDLNRIVEKINDEFKNDKTVNAKGRKNAEFSIDGGQSYADILDIFKKKKSMFGQKIILCANGADHGQTTYLAPAVFHVLDHLPVFSLSLPQIFSSNYRAAEEAVSEIMSTAAKFCPCVVYIPSVDVLMRVAPHSAWYTLVSIVESWSHSLPILLFATANECYRSLDDEIKNIFDEEASVLIMQPNAHRRQNFFAKLFNEEALIREEIKQEKQYDPLPEAPPSRPKQLTENEKKKFRKLERRTLRELRIFLREILGRLIRDRRFAFFAKPVDPEQAPDYTQIVENPMYFSLMMNKIDQHKYDKVQAFLDDIDLITRNALEYNPDREEMGKVIRHRACALRDVAYALIEEEYDSEFEQQCEELEKFRKERELGESTDLPPAFVYVAPLSAQNIANANEPSSTSANDGRSPVKPENGVNLPTRKDSDRAAAIVKKYKATRRLNLQKTPNGDLCGLNSSHSDMSASNFEKEISFDNDIDRSQESNAKNGHDKLSERDSGSAKSSVTFDRHRLNRLLDLAVSLTNDWPILRIEKLYTKIVRSIDRHAASSDKNPLIEELESVLRSQ